MAWKAAASALVLCLCLAADEHQLKRREPVAPNGVTEFRVAQGERIAVKFLTTVTISGAAPDRYTYLKTVFPVTAADRIVIPAGSYLEAEIAGLGRVRDRGRVELELKLARLTLPNGAQRLLHGEPAAHKNDAAAKSAHQSCPDGAAVVPVNSHAGDVFVMPGTTAEIVLRDPIVFTPEDVGARSSQ